MVDRAQLHAALARIAQQGQDGAGGIRTQSLSHYNYFAKFRLKALGATKSTNATLFLHQIRALLPAFGSHIYNRHYIVGQVLEHRLSDCGRCSVNLGLGAGSYAPVLLFGSFVANYPPCA
jgi:hypothetical protein